MTVPLVSVVMPVHNGGTYLSGAIDSVRCQTLRELELVVVDDGSTDGSADVVRAAAAVDPRVRLVEQPRGGISRALNAGLRVAAAPWIARLDADDEALPDRLERQLAAARRNPEVVVWAGWATIVGVSGRALGEVAIGPLTLQEFRRAHAAGFVEILHPTVLARRDVLLDVGGYDPRFDGGEDVELWDRVGEVGPILTLPERLIRFRVHGDSQSTVRFRRGLEIHRFVAARRAARSAGSDLEWEEFASGERAEALPRRMRREVVLRAAWHYRLAGVAVAESNRFSAVGHLLRAGLLAPRYVAARLWRQVLRPRLSRSHRDPR